LKHFWCMDEPWAYTDSQNSHDSSWPELGGSHHFPPYNIFCDWPWGYTQMSFFLGPPKLGVPKFPKLGLLQFWRPRIFCVQLRLRWGLKKNCNPYQELSNNMWHATCTQVNQGDAQLLMIDNQIDTLTIDLFSAIICVLSTQMDHASPF
jgi:hypothetical protein